MIGIRCLSMSWCDIKPAYNIQVQHCSNIATMLQPQPAHNVAIHNFVYTSDFYIVMWHCHKIVYSIRWSCNQSRSSRIYIKATSGYEVLTCSQHCDNIVSSAGSSIMKYIFVRSLKLKSIFKNIMIMKKQYLVGIVLQLIYVIWYVYLFLCNLTYYSITLYCSGTDYFLVASLNHCSILHCLTIFTSYQFIMSGCDKITANLLHSFPGWHELCFIWIVFCLLEMHISLLHNEIITASQR